MKVAILGEHRHGFIKPMSLGLGKMLDSLGVEWTFFDRGLAMLDHTPGYGLKALLRNGLKAAVNLIKPRTFELQHRVRSSEVKAFEQQIGQYDLVVVVSPLPKSFLSDQLCGIERLRRLHDVPIALYQNYYLATRGDWASKIRNSGKQGGYGLERYDWYLAASLVSETPLDSQAHPVSLIGHDLRADNLTAENKLPFRALLDFPRNGLEAERTLQKQALESLGIPYTELRGRYTQDQIRALYRSHSALFLSSRESFGLPIVENQLCGSLIFTPHNNWAPSHYLNKPVFEAGEGSLGSNFVVYDNDLDTLKRLLLTHRDDYDPQRVVTGFKAEYPHLYHGDIQALKSVLEAAEQGRLTGRSHQAYDRLLDNLTGR